MQAIFPNGNFDSWKFCIEQYLPKAMQTVSRTVVPIISAALLQLVGNSQEFQPEQAQVSFTWDEAGLPMMMNVVLSYKVPSFRTTASKDAVNHDILFILGYLRQIPELKNLPNSSVTIDTSAGIMTASIALKVGYAL